MTSSKTQQKNPVVTNLCQESYFAYTEPHWIAPRNKLFFLKKGGEQEMNYYIWQLFIKYMPEITTMFLQQWKDSSFAT